jgi:uncharacterized Zn-binding protein involved in type VI secretion
MAGEYQKLILVNGDIGSHGDGTEGVAVATATKTYVEGKLVVLTGDVYVCEHEDHNSETIISTLTKTYAEGKLMCNISATVSCGAEFILSPGAPNADTHATKTHAE